MAQQGLTERQKEIQALVKQGKKPPQIADDLGISTNAVYQQLRRIRGGKSGPKSKPKAKAKAKTGAKLKSVSAPKAKAAPKAAAESAPARPATPLQSVRARRDEIAAQVREATVEVEAAERALNQAREQAAKVKDRHKDELKALEAAEKALRPKQVEKPAAKPKPKAKPKPAAKKPATAKKPAAKASPSSNGATGASGAGNGASGASEPQSQAEREAAAEHSGEPDKTTA